MPSKRKPPPKKATTTKTAATKKSAAATPIRKSTRKPVQFVPFSGAATSTSTPKSKPKTKGATKAAKKSKVESKAAATTRKGTTKKTTTTASKKGLKVAKGKVTKKTAAAVKKEPKEKKIKTPRIKNDKLKQRPEIDILEQNPIIHGKGKPGDPDTLETVIRLVYRWTHQQDITNLKKIANDWKHFPTNGFELRYSPFDSRTPEFIALQNGNKKLFDAIRAAKKDAEKQREKRPAFEINSLLQKMTTGQANIHMLGHRTAKIEATRGGRQGNNALILFDDLSSDMETGKRLIDSGVSFEMLAHAADEVMYSKDSMVYRAVRAGHRKLAASMIEAWAKYNFNDLHINTLKFDKEPLPKFMPISTTKKALGNKKITPVHTAAINPNVEYLKAILAVEPVFNQPDTDNWYTIHYAAVCEGPTPLKYLIERGAPLSILNKNKESPLHCAARAGRLENVKVIIEALLKEKLPEAVDEDAIIPKKSKTLSHFGNMLNAKTKVNETPLHYAVKYEHLEVVKYLLKQPEIIVDAPMSAGAEKLTPLILAAQKGNLAIFRVLIDEGHAFMDLGDKFKRTPLIHATIGGHPHIVSELLHRGASINSAPDSSGNTAAHYASAYSWGSILRLLEKAEPTCLTQINSWHLTPLCVAFLKNHMDIVAYLLDEDHGEIKISVNDCDNEGNTLLMLVLKHESTIGEDKNLIAKIEYLIENGANVEIKSATGKTAFHYFASKPVVLKATTPAYGSRGDVNKKRFTKDEYFKIVELLTGDKKTEIAGMIDDSGNTVLEEALEQGNILLAEKVFEWTKKEAIERWAKNFEQNETHSNILHLIFDAVKSVYKTSNSFEYNLGFLKLFESIAKEAKAKTLESGKTLLQALASQFDKYGRTPLIYILREIKQFRVPASTTEEQVQTDEIRKIILQVVELARGYLKVDKESAFVREKPKKKDDSAEQNEMRNNAFGFRMQLGGRKQKHQNPSSKEAPYYPSAFELCLRFWVVGFGEEYMLKEKKLTHRNPLLKMVVEELKESGLLERALLEQDERNGFKGYSPLLFCIQNDVKDSTTFILKISEDLKLTKKVCGQILEKVFDHEKNEYKTVNKSALLLAVEKRNLLVAKYLAAYTDLASKVDESGRNALHYLSTSPENVVDFLDAIISRGAKPAADNFGRYPLHYAIGAIHSTASTDISTDNIEYLIKMNPESANKFDNFKRLPIHYAFIPVSEKEEKHFDYSQVPKADPIAVVVVILKQTKELSTPDIYGNTLLHYAAMAGSNICLLTLIDKCRDINYKNKLSNIPLGLAVARSNESATMTLIQAGGDVRAQVFCLPPEPFKAEDEKWKWFPDRCAEQKQVSHTILSLVVRNGWQGIIYVILDKLNNQQNVLKNLCAAAIEHRQFNLAQTLLKKLKNDNSVKKEASILFEKLSEYCNIHEEPASNLMRSLFAAGMLWQEYETANSRAAEIYAEKCDLQGLQLLKTLDQEFNNGQNWHEHLRSRGSLQVLKNLFKAWKGNLPKTEALRLLACISEYAIACGNVSTRFFDFNKPAFDGMEHPKHKKPIPEKQNITPLIYAVQVRKYGLAEFLLGTLKVDVNAPDEMGRTALMHAIMSNDEQMIKILARMKKGHGTEIADASMMEVVVEDDDDAEENGTMEEDDSEASEASEEEEESEDESEDEENDGTEDDDSQPPPPKRKAMLLARKSKVAKRKAPKTSKKNKKDTKLSFSFKNSKMNVAATDAHGKTALHYLVEPNGYENVTLVRQLFKAETGFIPLITKNNSDGESPLSLASKLRQKDIYALFQSHVRKGQSNGFTASAIQDSSELPKTVSLKSSHDFEKVSQEFVQSQSKAQQKVESEEEKEKRLRTPHHLVQNYDISEIVKDDEDGSLYSTLMHKTDIQYGFQGYHNYYRIQLVQRKGGANLYVLFTHWGRIGDPTGQCQHTPFSDKEAAVKEFKSIFKAKSGNEWGQEFEEKPNKYRLVEIDESKVDLSELKIELKSNETLKDPVYDIIKDVSDVEWMRRKWKTVCSQAANAIPFGHVKREKILKAKAILDQLRPLIAKFETDRYSSNTDPTDALQKITKTGKLTNEFYMELALGSFAYSSLPVIDNDRTLQVYDKLIEQMLEFEIAGKLLTAAAGQKEMDPFKYIKDCIECDIKLLDSESLEAQRILQYIRNSAQNVKVTGIYSVLSKAGVEFFDEKGRKAKNHKYLWHGTKPENLLSILKLGLLATPPHAIMTGNLFGEGIYFAETFVKSYNYCTESSKGQKYALLCEVALGSVFTSSSLCEMQSTSSADAKAKDTLKIAGKNIPNDKFEITAPTGVRLPLGEMQRNEKLESNWGAMDYSEYIVKDRSNVIIRYLVSFE